MTVQEKFAELKTRPWLPPEGCAPMPVSAVEDRWEVSLPSDLVTTLEIYGAPVCFDTSVMFRPKEPSRWVNRDGTLDLTCLYGLVTGSHGLDGANQTFLGNVPGHCIVIGDSSFGNQICLDRGSGQILFWDHEAETDAGSLFLIADDFGAFVNLLAEGDDRPRVPLGLIKSKSWLDF